MVGAWGLGFRVQGSGFRVFESNSMITFAALKRTKRTTIESPSPQPRWCQTHGHDQIREKSQHIYFYLYLFDGKPVTANVRMRTFLILRATQVIQVLLKRQDKIITAGFFSPKRDLDSKCPFGRGQASTKFKAIGTRCGFRSQVRSHIVCRFWLGQQLRRSQTFCLRDFEERKQISV